MTDLVVRKLRWEFDARPLPVAAGRSDFGVWRLPSSQTPHHDPHDQPLPHVADTWMREYERGTDMTTYFGGPPAELQDGESDA